MKYFVASPWRNKNAVQALEAALVLRGHTAWSFLDNGANLARGTSVIEEFKQFGLSMTNWEDNPLIERIFTLEMQALGDCDAVVLLEQIGRAHV